MRTFHTGGIANSAKISQGLPCAEELFEARKPKGQAIMADISGIVSIGDAAKRKREVTVTAEDGSTKTYSVNYGSTLLVSDGDTIEAGDLITEGSVNLARYYALMQHPLVLSAISSRRLSRFTNNNGVDINDKHVEIICRQMMRKVRIE